MFFTRKPKKAIEKSIGATLYPDRIILDTRNKKDDFIWYSTDNISILPVNISDADLSDAMIDRLNESVQSDIPHEQIKELRASLRKKAKFKSEKDSMKDARLVTVYLADKHIRFEPFKILQDGQQYTGLRLADSVFTMDISIDKADMGRQLRKAWDLC